MNIRWNEGEDEADYYTNNRNSGGQSDQELYMINMREIIPVST